MQTLTYNLNEKDIANIDTITTAFVGTRVDGLYQAIKLCRFAIEEKAQGYSLACHYTTGDHLHMSNLPLKVAADAINYRGNFYEAHKVQVGRRIDLLEDIAFIKKSIKAAHDETAIAFAAEYAASCVKEIKGHNGTVRLCVHKGSWDTARNVKSVLNKTAANAFNRACRKLRQKIRKLSAPKQK